MMLPSVVAAPLFTKGQDLVTQERHFVHMEVSILQEIVILTQHLHERQQNIIV